MSDTTELQATQADNERAWSWINRFLDGEVRAADHPALALEFVRHRLSATAGVVAYIEAAFAGFRADPCDSDHQRGYLAALIAVYTEALGLGVDSVRVTTLRVQTVAPATQAPTDAAAMREAIREAIVATFVPECDDEWRAVDNLTDHLAALPITQAYGGEAVRRIDASTIQRFGRGDEVSHNAGVIEADSKRHITAVLGYDPNGGVRYRLALSDGSDRGLAYDDELDPWPGDDAPLPIVSPGALPITQAAPLADDGREISDADVRQIAAAIYLEVADEPLGDLFQRRDAVQQQWFDAVRAAVRGLAA